MTNCEILDAYESGVSSIELSRLTGLSAAAIRKRASLAGVRRPRRNLSQRQRIVELSTTTSLTGAQIALQVGCCRSHVHVVMREYLVNRGNAALEAM